MCFDFFYKFFSNTLLIPRRNERGMIKCTHVFIWSIRYSCQILIKLEFSLQIFEQYSNIKFHENTSSGSRVFPRGRTDGETRRGQQSLCAILRKEPESCMHLWYKVAADTSKFRRGCWLCCRRHPNDILSWTSLPPSLTSQATCNTFSNRT
jgi:hypothetical protein